MVKRYRGGYLPNRPNTTTGILTPAEKASPVTSLTATATGYGGTEETLGPYRVHTFTSSGSLTITNASENGVDLEYLLVAGGGGARSHATAYASGGGGGVSIWHNNRAITDINTGPSFRVFNGDVITVVIGGGGSSATTQGSQGGNTSITVSGTVRTVITTGGGGGSQNTSTSGQGGTGGSGGGNGFASTDALYSLTVSGISIGWPKQGTDSQYRAGGASWLPCNWQGLDKQGSGAANTNIPGYGLRTAFNSTVAEFGVGTKITCPANRGFGGRAQGASGVNPGSSGIAILRYLTNTDVAATGAELLVVAGGAGGSAAGQFAVNQGSGAQNGAGGAGGLVYFGAETPKTPDGPAFTLYKGTYQVVVGAGSAGGGSTGAAAATEYLGGNHSSFLHPPGYLATAFKGLGRGVTSPPYDNPEGAAFMAEDYWGSGGGVNWVSAEINFRSYVYPNQGNRGGYQANSGGGSYSGPGGGGAGAAGGNSTDTGSTTLCVAGAGGAGLQYSISGTATYYAGGGGGFCYRSGFVGAGGAGGGGTGGSNGSGRTSAQYGQANTGGGGASWYPTSTAASQNVPGGSGIVILRYPDSYPVATSTSGSPTYTNTAGWHIYKFTASGSITFA